MDERKIALKKKISQLEAQEYNINKLLKVLNDKDFDTYTFTVEAAHEDESFRDKQVVKFYDFSTLKEALTKAMPQHLLMLQELIEDARTELNNLNNEQEVQEPADSETTI